MGDGDLPWSLENQDQSGPDEKPREPWRCPPRRPPRRSQRRRRIIWVLAGVVAMVVILGVVFNSRGNSRHTEASSRSNTSVPRPSAQFSAPGNTAPGSAAPGPARGSSPSSSPQPTAAAGAVCLSTSGWTTATKATRPVHQTAPIVTSGPPGIHDNCDRLVLILRGASPAHVGFTAGYTQSIVTEPKGDPVDLEGHPAIRLVVLAPSRLAVSGGYVFSPSYLQAVAKSLHSSYKELRWVKFAGSSEGQTTLVISVDDQRPFEAFTTFDNAGNLVLVLDIARADLGSG